MKVTSYILPVCAVALAALGYQYASNQATTLRMLVDARAGLGAGDAGGMAGINKSLEKKAIAEAQKRAETVKSNEQALVMARKAQEDLDAAKFVLEENNGKLEDIKARIAEAQRRYKEVEAENERVMNALHSVPLLADVAPEDANARIEEHVKEYDAEYEQLKERMENKTAERTRLTGEVAALEVDLANKLDTNKRFMDNYLKNTDEYIIEAVDPQWHFVVFSAANSGLYAGESSPLLVQRNGTPITTVRVISVNGDKIVAEYDEKTLPRGVKIEAGDRVFRQKPLGS